jgi:hypothetical protein
MSATTHMDRWAINLRAIAFLADLRANMPQLRNDWR